MRNMPRVFTSFMPNAPRLAGVPGAMLDIFKKCLSGGWTPFDITSIVVTNGVGKINFNYPDCSLPDYCYLTITGCSEPQLNTEVCIERGYATSGEFPTTVADGTYNAASGDTIKATPVKADWQLMFTGANTGIFRSNNLDSSQTVVRMDDTRALVCDFNFGSDAIGIDSIVDQPNFSVNARNIYKAWNASASSFRNWAIVADNTTVYITVDSTQQQYAIPKREDFMGGRWHGFGDYLSDNPASPVPFFYFLSAVNYTDNNYYNYGDDTPWVSGPALFNITAARAAVRSSNFASTPWTIGSFTVSQLPVHNAIRVSGSVTNFTNFFNDTMFSGMRKAPVYTTFGNLTLQLGHLPGIRYSDYNFRLFLQKTFGTKKPTGSDDVYLMTPIGSFMRSSEVMDATSGVVPFIINKKWDE